MSSVPASSLERRAVVLFGSPGTERKVSVASAQHVCEHLPEADLWFWAPDGRCYELTSAELRAHQRPFELDFPTEGRTPFAPTIDAALERARDEGRILFLSLHGGDGENGELAAKCEALGVAFTGSGSEASRKAFDKVRAKQIAKEAGARVLEALTVPAGTPDGGQTRAWFERHGALVAKPVRDGSSFGLYFLKEASAVDSFCSAPHELDYLIEPFTVGNEATVGVMDTPDGARPLEPVEIVVAAGKTFDYTGKYLDAQTQELCPSDLPAEVKAQLKRAAAAVHTAIGAEGYSRTDFIVTPTGPVFLEINTLPGLTKQSLFPRELRADGIGIRDFLLGQLEAAQTRAAR